MRSDRVRSEVITNKLTSSAMLPAMNVYVIKYCSHWDISLLGLTDQHPSILSVKWRQQTPLLHAFPNEIIATARYQDVDIFYQKY